MMNKYQIRYSPEAIEDLKSIYLYISEELLAPDTAKRTVNKIRTVIRGLEVMPNRHVVVDWEPWLSMGMRKAIVDKYLAFYLVDDTSRTVTVARVFYGGRDIENIVLGEKKVK